MLLLFNRGVTESLSSVLNGLSFKIQYSTDQFLQSLILDFQLNSPIVSCAGHYRRFSVGHVFNSVMLDVANLQLLFAGLVKSISDPILVMWLSAYTAKLIRRTVHNPKLYYMGSEGYQIIQITSPEVIMPTSKN